MTIPVNPLVDPLRADTTLSAAAAMVRLLSELDQEKLSAPARASLSLLSALVADALDYERRRVDQVPSRGPPD